MEFRQPFLVLELRPDGPRSHEIWYIDVEGNIDDYLAGASKILAGYQEVSNRDDPESYFALPNLESVDFHEDATDQLKHILKQMQKAGWEILSARVYHGSAGPSHLYRYGLFWKRQAIEKRQPEISGSIPRQPTSADARKALGL